MRGVVTFRGDTRHDTAFGAGLRLALARCVRHVRHLPHAGEDDVGQAALGPIKVS